jgi:hypothetical protein
MEEFILINGRNLGEGGWDGKEESKDPWGSSNPKGLATSPIRLFHPLPKRFYNSPTGLEPRIRATPTDLPEYSGS